MRIAVTGFVSESSGSVASANALLLRALLEHGWQIRFFSKSRFVDPRPAVGNSPFFEFEETDNVFFDRARSTLQGRGLLGSAAGLLDATSYNRLLVRRIRVSHLRKPFDLVLWLGDYARGTVPGVPTISFAQGPPGTDARSVIHRFHEITQVAGLKAAWKWRLLASLRLSRLGRPQLAFSDRILVGSKQSSKVLQNVYDVAEKRIRILPYPVDFGIFRIGAREIPSSGPLRIVWLGRIIPRKRMDLFLGGTAEAIRRGMAGKVTIIGTSGFVPGYDKLIESFPYPQYLTCIRSVPREEVPAIFGSHDVLVQPSDEENFGSSVAEAQACGLPVIVGSSNGNADYLCPRDIHLADDRVETLAEALKKIDDRRHRSQGGDALESRRFAESHFSIERVAIRLMEILHEAAGGKGGKLSFPPDPKPATQFP